MLLKSHHENNQNLSYSIYYLAEPPLWLDPTTTPTQKNVLFLTCIQLIKNHVVAHWSTKVSMNQWNQYWILVQNDVPPVILCHLCGLFSKGPPGAPKVTASITWLLLFPLRIHVTGLFTYYNMYIYIYIPSYKNQPFMATAMVHQFWVFVVASSSRYGQTHLTWSIRRTTHRCAGRLWGHSNRWHQPWSKRWHEAAGKACYESCLTYMDGI